MFCRCIDRGCVDTGESKLCSECVLTVGALVQERVSYVLYCIDRGCVVTGESKLCSVCILTEGALVKGRLSCVLYVYCQRVGWFRRE